MRVFLLHGLGQGPDSWIAAAENLLPKAELVCPDLAAWVREGADCYDRLYGRMEALEYAAGTRSGRQSWS